ncbi:hypothetical protein LJB99_06725 [Deltaproteobacteria bacterium OttesenSCG-928-K17]|nr:hypothetical protein [Deltaproteobacteria bacterium OttesenSCG-928-K17]
MDIEFLLAPKKGALVKLGLTEKNRAETWVGKLMPVPIVAGTEATHFSRRQDKDIPCRPNQHPGGLKLQQKQLLSVKGITLRQPKSNDSDTAAREPSNRPAALISIVVVK